MVLEVDQAYTSQRCPKCGRIHKENRDHDTHTYTCDCCGYQSNELCRLEEMPSWCLFFLPKNHNSSFVLYDIRNEGGKYYGINY